MVVKSRHAVTLRTVGMSAGGTLMLIGLIGKPECSGFSCDSKSDLGLVASGTMLMVATVAGFWPRRARPAAPWISSNCSTACPRMRRSTSGWGQPSE